MTADEFDAMFDALGVHELPEPDADGEYLILGAPPVGQVLVIVLALFVVFMLLRG